MHVAWQNLILAYSFHALKSPLSTAAIHCFGLVCVHFFIFDKDDSPDWFSIIINRSKKLSSVLFQRARPNRVDYKNNRSLYNSFCPNNHQKLEVSEKKGCVTENQACWLLRMDLKGTFTAGNLILSEALNLISVTLGDVSTPRPGIWAPDPSTGEIRWVSSTPGFFKTL